MGSYRVRPITYSDTVQRIFKAQAGADVRAMEVTFVVTQDCNLRCNYCYQTNKNNAGKITRETIARTIDLLYKMDAENSRYVNSENAYGITLAFIGGEPLLELDLIEFAIEYFRKKAMELGHRWLTNHMISMSSNGTLYKTKEVQRFIHKYGERLSLGISIDGDKQLHDACRIFPDGTGSYDIVVDAFKDLLEKNPNATTKSTQAPDNVHYLSAAITSLFDLGIKYVNANCVFEKGWEIGHARTLYSELIKLANWLLTDGRYKEYGCSYFSEFIGRPLDPTDNGNWCGGTGKMIAVGADDKIYPCLRYMSYCLPDNLEPITIGNLKDGVDNTPQDKATVDLLNSITRRSQSTDECYACPVGSGCAWCSAYNYQEGGINKRVTYICDMHKARVLANHYYWNKLYELEGTGQVYPLNLAQADINNILGTN